MDSKDFVALNAEYVFNTYGRTPIMLVEGSGCVVRDSEGREYLDFIGGLAACSLGHAYPKLVQAIAEQAGKLIHVSNIFYIQPQIEIARLLVENTFADKAFFCNSGAEANEGAIKIARKYFHDQGAHDRYHIITMENSFHGRTMATLAATGQTKYRKGFEPEVQGFSQVKFGVIGALEKAVDARTAAIFVEPIQGEGGVRMAAPEYFQAVRNLCDKTGCLLMMDEVQTGMGRTGKFLAHEHFGIIPDVVTLAKGIAGGVPMGAVLAVDKAAGALVPGTHASTFGGNPLCSAAAVAVTSEILSDGFLDSVVEKGQYLRSRLEDLAAKLPIIKEVRGMGLMQAVDLRKPGSDITVSMRDHGVLVNCTSDTVLRFLPPLVVTKDEIDKLIDVLDFALTKAGGAEHEN